MSIEGDGEGRNSRQFLEDVFDAIQDGISVLDNELNIVRVNPWMARMYGGHSTLEGRKCYRIYQKRDSVCPWCPTVKALESGEKHTAVVPYPSEEDVQGWIELSAFPLLDASGRAVGVIEYVKDITAQKLAETALSRSDAFNRSLVENAPLGILFLDPAGRINYMNPAIKRMVGIPPEEEPAVMGHVITDIGPIADAGGKEIFQRVMAGEAISGHLVRYTSLAGVTVDLELHASTICDANGDLEGIILLASNVTDRETLQAQLLQAQKMEAVGQLAGGVAHDFNNLLSPILGYADMAIGELDFQSPVMDFLREIRDAAQRASDLTRRLLAFSRKQVLERRLVDLNGLVTDFSRMLERLIGDDVEFRVEPFGKPLLTEADPSQLQQVLMNLALNARDAMPQGGSLTVRTGRRELDPSSSITYPPADQGGFVFLRVEDTGAGMDPGMVERIFEPFFSTKAKSGGTGLGLPTVYGIVRQHGGALDVTSTPGSGSLFTVFLPESGKHVEDVRPSAESQPLPDGEESIVVVEDDASVRRMVEVALSAHGYTVRSIGNPAEAVELASGKELGETDLLLTDMAMPYMNGRELFESLSRKMPGLKVLFMSGYTLEPGQLPGSTSESTNFLRKPFTVRSLLESVKRVLDQT
jgi:two-component system NtrC family sensor kinase